MTTDMVEHMKSEVEVMEALMTNSDFLESAAAFMEKREPVFKGNLSSNSVRTALRGALYLPNIDKDLAA